MPEHASPLVSARSRAASRTSRSSRFPRLALPRAHWAPAVRAGRHPRRGGAVGHHRDRQHPGPGRRAARGGRDRQAWPPGRHAAVAHEPRHTPAAGRVHPCPAVAARPRRLGRGRVPGHLLPGRGTHRRRRGHRDRAGQRAGVRGPAGLGYRPGAAGGQVGRRHHSRRARLRRPGPGARAHRSRQPGGRHGHPARRAGRAVLRLLLAHRPHADRRWPPGGPRARGDVRCGGTGRAPGPAGQRHRMARQLARCRGGVCTWRPAPRSWPTGSSGAACAARRAQVATTLTLAEPAVATLLGVAVLGERLPAVSWCGLAVLAVGLASLAVPANRRRRPGPENTRTASGTGEHENGVRDRRTRERRPGPENTRTASGSAR